MRRNSDLLSTFKHAQGEFSKIFCRNHVNRYLYVYYLFVSLKNRSSTVQWLALSTSKPEIVGLNLTFVRYFLNFSGTFWLFRGKFLDFIQVIFLNISGSLLINSINIIDKNWSCPKVGVAALVALKFPGTFLDFSNNVLLQLYLL